MKPALIVHGGAWDIPDEAIDACKSGCSQALAAGWPILSRGGHALDAIEAAIMVLEDDPVFDAGYGSHLNLDGRVECDAIVMNGATLHAGAACTLQRVKNPIRVARAILENCPHMMLVAEGAERFAREQGTVGAVAIDQNGNLFAATSTGGTCCKLPGRVGDSPLIGCGCYADSEAGAVSCTGYGEAIMKIVMAKTAVDFLRQSPICVDSPSGASCEASLAQVAAREAVHLLAKRTHGTGGLILLDCQGNPGFAFNTPRMAYGYVALDGNFVTAV